MYSYICITIRIYSCKACISTVYVRVLNISRYSKRQTNLEGTFLECCWRSRSSTESTRRAKNPWNNLYVHEYNTSVSYFCTNSKYCISLRLEEIDNTLFVVQCTLKMKVKTHTKFERTTHRFFQLFTLPPCLKSQPAISGSPGGDIRRFAGLSMAPPSPPAGGGLDFFAGTGSWMIENKRKLRPEKSRFHLIISEIKVRGRLK